MSHVPGYSSARPFPSHQPPVRSPYGTPDHPLTPKRARRSGVLAILGLIVVPSLGIGAVAIVGEHLSAPDPQITVQSGVGFGAYDGTELALVPYDRVGNGGLIESMQNDMFEVRLAAVELATGDTAWDVKLTDELGWNAAVVAAGEQYAYLNTDDGLQIRSLSDGSVAVEAGEVTGLEGAQAVSGAAYAFDPALGAVVALDVNGGVHVIALDTLEAVPSDADTAATWSGLLFAEGPVPDIGGMTTTEALLADGESSLRIEPTADGALGGSLVLESPDGERALGTRVFYEAAIVLDQAAVTSTFSVDIDVDELIEDFMEDAAAAGQDLWTGLGETAAGAASGHALIEHKPDPAGEGYALHVISLETGQVTASLNTGDHLGRALTGANGYTAVIAAPEGDTWHSDLVLVAPDGSIDRVEIGATDLFGDPA
ncbi:PA2928 family protein [Glycomyces rhizosphaerae]|uniref:PA2928 family protein n=1 Tax=Glycomyces rhizosphaerae TaxID=2054422 RepID=A0ABV7Q5D3_9ACTN